MNNKLISVIVPVYNVEHYLNRCVDSILAQTYSDLEILLVDDGSTDSSGAICDAYARQDARVQVIPHPRQMNFRSLYPEPDKQAKQVQQY